MVVENGPTGRTVGDAPGLDSGEDRLSRCLLFLKSNRVGQSKTILEEVNELLPMSGSNYMLEISDTDEIMFGPSRGGRIIEGESEIITGTRKIFEIYSEFRRHFPFDLQAEIEKLGYGLGDEYASEQIKVHVSSSVQDILGERENEMLKKFVLQIQGGENRKKFLLKYNGNKEKWDRLLVSTSDTGRIARILNECDTSKFNYLLESVAVDDVVELLFFQNSTTLFKEVEIGKLITFIRGIYTNSLGILMDGVDVDKLVVLLKEVDISVLLKIFNGSMTYGLVDQINSGGRLFFRKQLAKISK